MTGFSIIAVLQQRQELAIPIARRIRMENDVARLKSELDECKQQIAFWTKRQDDLLSQLNSLTSSSGESASVSAEKGKKAKSPEEG